MAAGRLRSTRRRLVVAWALAVNLLAPCSQLDADETAEKASPASVLGRVLDPTGKPLPGAEIVLHAYKQAPSKRWGRWEQFGMPLVADSSGRFQFEKLADGYYLLAAKIEGMATAYKDFTLGERKAEAFDIVLNRPVAPVILLTDDAGNPVSGARVRAFRRRGANGDCYLPQLSLRSLGIDIPPSGADGRLQLPPLPEGESLEITIEHPTLAPVRIDELKAADGVAARATMKPGVVFTLQVAADDAQSPIDHAVIDLRHEPFRHPSTTVHYELDFDAAGKARLAVEPGRYNWLLLQHAGYYLTPVVAADGDSPFRIEPGRNDHLTFQLHRKVPVRGRVVDADTGKTIRGAYVMGEIAGAVPPHNPEEKWSFAGWGDDNADGSYTMMLAAGSARVSFNGSEERDDQPSNLVSENEYVEFDVAPDGSTVVPDIRVRPLPTFRGVVKNADGSPVPRAVFCFPGKYQPQLADEQGRFEIQPKWVPTDPKTGRRQLEQKLFAFDPYRPLAARRIVRFDKAEELSLTLEPHGSGWPFSEISDSLNDWQRGIVPPDQAERNESLTLRGKPAPELEGAAWLNTNGQPLTPAELRGKYLLLDFWFIGCGPCHADFPSVKAVHELYKDKGVVVIGIHNNSNSPDAVREHVAKLGLPFPVMVDYPDGRTVAKFQRHGIADGYPNYVLIGPDGNVLLDDRTIPHPALRSYKVEIIRKHLLSGETPGK
jgi:thiol-disulfide isomerase/thioredoxin